MRPMRCQLSCLPCMSIAAKVDEHIGPKFPLPDLMKEMQCPHCLPTLPGGTDHYSVGDHIGQKSLVPPPMNEMPGPLSLKSCKAHSAIRPFYHALPIGV